MPMSPNRNGKRFVTYSILFTLDEYYIIVDSLTKYAEGITDKYGKELAGQLIHDLELLAEEDAE